MSVLLVGLSVSVSVLLLGLLVCLSCWLVCLLVCLSCCLGLVGLLVVLVYVSWWDTDVCIMVGYSCVYHCGIQMHVSWIQLCVSWWDTDVRIMDTDVCIKVGYI